MFALFLCLGVASAVTYRHDGVDTMKLDDDGNLTVNGNLKSNGATITGDLNVTGTAYLDDVTVNADNITINNIVPKDGGVVGVSGNLSTGGTGFFGWLGSLASRITALFVGDIDFSGSIKSDSGSLNLIEIGLNPFFLMVNSYFSFAGRAIKYSPFALAEAINVLLLVLDVGLTISFCWKTI
jgi:hypothetical protein